jgi:myo-inositol-1(or 4)-monophosphatase
VHDIPAAQSIVPATAELEQAAIDVATLAAAMIRSNVGRARAVAAKSSATDIVTQTDLDSERLIRERIAVLTPSAGVLGEEGGQSDHTARVQWIIDPLDGTINFLYDLPVFAVSAAVAVDGTVVAGAVADVLRNEVFSAGRGTGARLDGIPISASRQDDLSQSMVATGFSYQSNFRADQASLLTTLLPAVRDIRCFGSAALHLCWVGLGRLDAYFERHIKLWDYAAGALVASEAGATVEWPCPENDSVMFAASSNVFDSLRILVVQ